MQRQITFNGFSSANLWLRNSTNVMTFSDYSNGSSIKAIIMGHISPVKKKESSSIKIQNTNFNRVPCINNLFAIKPKYHVQAMEIKDSNLINQLSLNRHVQSNTTLSWMRVSDVFKFQRYINHPIYACLIQWLARAITNLTNSTCNLCLVMAFNWSVVLKASLMSSFFFFYIIRA